MRVSGRLYPGAALPGENGCRSYSAIALRKISCVVSTSLRLYSTYSGVMSPCCFGWTLRCSTSSALLAASTLIFSPVSPATSWWRSRKLRRKLPGGVIGHDSGEFDRGLVTAQVFDPDAWPVGVAFLLPALHVGVQIKAEATLEVSFRRHRVPRQPTVVVGQVETADQRPALVSDAVEVSKEFPQRAEMKPRPRPLQEN